MQEKAIFLDRDGTLIFDMGYNPDVKDTAYMPGVLDSLKILQDDGFLLIIVSNQGGPITKGITTPKIVEEVNQRVFGLAADKDVWYRDLIYCSHDPYAKEMCKCRKPEPGMILEMAKKHDIDLRQSYMVGDRSSDVVAGKRAGCKESILLNVNMENGIDGEQLKNYEVFQKYNIFPSFTAYTWAEILHYIGKDQEW